MTVSGEQRPDGDGVPARPVRRPPLGEVGGARPDRRDLGVEPRADGRESGDDRRGHRYRGGPQHQPSGCAVERQPDHRHGPDHQGDRPHPVEHRPQPDEGDQPPADAAVAASAQPGADHDRDQQVADHLRPHRQPVLHREEGDRGHRRCDQGLGAVAAHDVEGDERARSRGTPTARPRRPARTTPRSWPSRPPRATGSAPSRGSRTCSRCRGGAATSRRGTPGRSGGGSRCRCW